MCVAFTGTAVFDYIFLAQEQKGTLKCVSKSELGTFCDKLASSITAHEFENPHYKYVYFDFDEQSLSEVLAENQNRYLDANDRIYGLVDMNENAAEINARYADRVIDQALADAFAATFSRSTRTAA